MYKFTPRQLKYRQYRLSGMSGKSAALKAGYSEATAQGGKLAKALVADISTSLEIANVTNRRLAEKISAEIDNEDASIGHKYLETALKITGRLTPQVTTNIDRAVINVFLPQLPETLDT